MTMDELKRLAANTPEREIFLRGRQQGIRDAAEFIGQWDQQIDHPHRMEDVVLCKFNLKPGRPRKKKVNGKTPATSIACCSVCGVRLGSGTHKQSCPESDVVCSRHLATGDQSEADARIPADGREGLVPNAVNSQLPPQAVHDWVSNWLGMMVLFALCSLIALIGWMCFERRIP